MIEFAQMNNKSIKHHAVSFKRSKLTVISVLLFHVQCHVIFHQQIGIFHSLAPHAQFWFTFSASDLVQKEFLNACATSETHQFKSAVFQNDFRGFWFNDLVKCASFILLFANIIFHKPLHLPENKHC